MEKRMRELRCGLTDEAMRLLRKCRRKKAKLKLKRLTDHDEGREMIDRVKQRYALEHKQFLEEEAKKEEQKKLNRAKKRPADRINRLVTERGTRAAITDDAIIDELLRDDSSDATSVEEADALENIKKSKNSFVKFENVGFRTNGSFVVKDEIVSPSSLSHPFRPSFSVPPSLSSLQKMAKPKVVKEVECVDLCSSDED